MMAPLHLLVVDDSPADLHLIRVAFEPYTDVHLTTLDQASIALAWMETQVVENRRPDLVLLDLQMPGMNGLDWLHEVSQRTALQDIPVLVYSLTPLDRQLQQIDPAQVCGHWQKPMSFTEMLEDAETLWTIWQREGHFHPAALHTHRRCDGLSGS